jgi:WD40 repeat protein
MALFDTEKEIIVAEKLLPFVVETSSRFQNYPVIFDRQGRMHLVKSFNKLETSQIPVKGQVTAFAESKNQKTYFYGMSDGTIYYVNRKGEISKLVGHRSRITKLKVNGHRLASSSYDGAINMWMTNQSKIEPMTLYRSRGWVINFTFDLKKNYIWAGDQGGNVSRALISVQAMQQQLKAKLKRDLTREEWNYYIGSNIPYETFIRKEARP